MKILKKYLDISKNARFSITLIGLLILHSCDISSSPEKLFSKANVERSQNNYKKAAKILRNWEPEITQIMTSRGAGGFSCSLSYFFYFLHFEL